MLIINIEVFMFIIVHVTACSQVKIGLIQNKIVLPTDAPIQDQVLIKKVSTRHFILNNFPLRSLVCSGGSDL